MQLKISARLAAVQVVQVASASLSAVYYATQAPAIALSIAGLATVNPAALGLGAMAFALDLTKSQFMQVAGTSGLEVARRLAAGAIFAVLFVASMIAVDGMLMRLRSDWAGERGNAITTYADLDAKVKRLTGELAQLGDTRPVATIDALLEGSVDANVWRRSKKCTDISRPDTKEACQPALNLYDERGRAVRKSELEPELKQAEKAKAKEKPPSVADPQAKAIADGTGLPESVVGYLMIAILGFALEIVACAGLWLLGDKPTPPATPAAPEAPISLTTEQQALNWVLGEMAKSGGKLTVLNTAIAAKFDVDPATATRWRQKWIEAGRLTEVRDGRQITLRLAK